MWSFIRSGGLFMTVSATFAGGGFAGPGGFRETALVILLSLLPPYTFIMATYDSTLFALLLATVTTAVVAVLLNAPPVAKSPTSPAVWE
jgi:hypothetical protein